MEQIFSISKDFNNKRQCNASNTPSEVLSPVDTTKDDEIENSQSNGVPDQAKDQKHKMMLKEYLEQIEYKEHQSRIGARGGGTEEYL